MEAALGVGGGGERSARFVLMSLLKPGANSAAKIYTIVAIRKSERLTACVLLAFA
jgi:hypothetical protein